MSGQAYRKLVYFIVDYMVDGKEDDPGIDLEKAMLAGLVDDVLRIIYHADELGLVKLGMGERFALWWRKTFPRAVPEPKP